MRTDLSPSSPIVVLDSGLGGLTVARALRAALTARTGARIAVVVSDTFGRPWRTGLTDVAIGAAGLTVLDDHRGRRDSHGNELALTVTAIADELAAAGDLAKGKTAGLPAAVVRGLARMRWGERLEFTAEAGPGGFIFVPPFVPHQEINALSDEPLECVLTRSGQQPVVVNLDIEGVADPEEVRWVDPSHSAQ